MSWARHTNATTMDDDNDDDDDEKPTNRPHEPVGLSMYLLFFLPLLFMSEPLVFSCLLSCLFVFFFSFFAKKGYIPKRVCRTWATNDISSPISLSNRAPALFTSHFCLLHVRWCQAGPNSQRQREKDSVVVYRGGAGVFCANECTSTVQEENYSLAAQSAAVHR